MPRFTEQERINALTGRYHPYSGQRGNGTGRFINQRYRRILRTFNSNRELWSQSYPRTFTLLEDHDIPTALYDMEALRRRVGLRNNDNSPNYTVSRSWSSDTASLQSDVWPERIPVLREIFILVVDGMMAGHIDSSKVVKDDSFCQREKRYIIRSLLPFIQAFTADNAALQDEAENAVEEEQ